jgi:RimJ/RimL family protein N-acetyltransferase
MIREDIRINDKLILSSLRKKDLPDLVNWMKDKKISENTLTIPFPYEKKDAEFFFHKIQNWEKEHGIKREWQIRLGDKMIGGLGLIYDSGINSHMSKIGYWIGRAHRKKGIMTDVLKVFIRYIFNHRPELLRLEAHVFPDNIASQKVLEKAGFLREAYLKYYYKKQEEYKDAIQYVAFNTTIS